MKEILNSELITEDWLDNKELLIHRVQYQRLRLLYWKEDYNPWAKHLKYKIFIGKYNFLPVLINP